MIMNQQWGQAQDATYFRNPVKKVILKILISALCLSCLYTCVCFYQWRWTTYHLKNTLYKMRKQGTPRKGENTFDLCFCYFAIELFWKKISGEILSKCQWCSWTPPSTPACLWESVNHYCSSLVDRDKASMGEWSARGQPVILERPILLSLW